MNWKRVQMSLILPQKAGIHLDLFGHVNVETNESEYFR